MLGFYGMTQTQKYNFMVFLGGGNCNEHKIRIPGWKFGAQRKVFYMSAVFSHHTKHSSEVPEEQQHQ